MILTAAQTSILTLFAVFFSWFLAQLSKFDKDTRLTLRQLFGVSGGRVSSHSASVTALAVSILLYDGFSLLFVMALLFAAIVIKDAMAVRFAVGENAVLLKGLLKVKDQTKVRVIKGHQPKEAVFGVVVGILVSLIFFVMFVMVVA